MNFEKVTEGKIWDQADPPKVKTPPQSKAILIQQPLNTKFK